MAMWGAFSPVLAAAANADPSFDLAVTEGSDVAACSVNVNASLSATEGSDSAAITSTVNASLSVTEGSDVAALAAGQAVAGEFALAATEGSDSVSLTSTVNASLVVTEGSDSAAILATANVALSATEGSDSAAILTTINASLSAIEGSDVVLTRVNVTASMAVTESSDSAAIVSTVNASLAATEPSDVAGLEVQKSGEFVLAVEEAGDSASMSVSAPTEAVERRPKRQPAIRQIVEGYAKARGVGSRLDCGRVSAVGYQKSEAGNAVVRPGRPVYVTCSSASAHGVCAGAATIGSASASAASGSVRAEGTCTTLARVSPSVAGMVSFTSRNRGRLSYGALSAMGIVNPSEEELVLAILAARQSRGRRIRLIRF